MQLPVRYGSAKAGRCVFVGTKKQAQQCVKETARECGQFYVTERWLGGTMTISTPSNAHRAAQGNRKDRRQRRARPFGEQEQAVIRREAARLQKYFDGIRDMDRIPAAIFVVDIKREHNAVAEARKLKVPVVAIVDTNCDPDLVDYPIAGNDDAIRSVRMILATISQIITRACAEHEAQQARRPAPEEAALEEARQ